MDKLSITNEMRCFDLKDRDFYNELTDEERRKFSNYLMIRWGSSVSGSRDLQEFYVISTNERLNRYFFAINKHPQLQWLCATAVSPGMGSLRHVWIAPKKRDAGSSSIKKTLMALYPTAKLDDIEVMSRLMTSADIKALVRDHGDSV